MNTSTGPATKIKKFYYLSLFCLIPGIGVLVGIILCIYAIARFKSTPLVLTILLMTAGGFGVAKLDSYYLANRMRTSKDVENGLILLVPNNLDLIVECLQKYKVRHGEFPDSLQQLEREAALVPVKDPFLGKHPEAHKSFYYNYQKTSEGYVLFSSGPDGIPHTKDDIYPRKPLK
ncbi:MAG TPA: hypothetical protein VMH27_19140 [Puia sp.]|nr:hypothetical protein [Puia sp.]